ncbi:unnamed protein product [Brassicogethes aeneus]|uniref:Glucosylceramidase n=1 Tax=Brassicogethes aeneus TaxID=1431903 RepID=A0A9P0F9E8_BRAAE|nr:unnamed protein product [Brassicogethes aeneus]
MKPIALFVILLISNVFSEECSQLNTKYGHVCVCNSTYCDTVPELNVSAGKYQIYTTSIGHLGFTSTIGELQKSTNEVSEHKINLVKVSTKQKVLGFGGAFTGSTGVNIKSLPEAAQEKLLKSYFGETGIQYNLCRVPIGGTDFSTKFYTYDDNQKGDVKLEHFALDEEDTIFKIPFIKKAMNLTNNSLKLFATAWTAPPWMKTNNDYTGVGLLKFKYYQTWADYYIKFFEEYSKNGVNFWGVTTQNEPTDGFLPKFLSKINSMGFTPKLMNKWIAKHLGPTIRNSTFKDLKIIVHDDSRQTLPLLPLTIENEDVIQFIDGVGVHWYLDDLLPTSWLKYTKSSKKELFLLGTEACNGYRHINSKSVELGSWHRAENYIKNILTDFEYGSIGWVDWNMVLDQEGGPCVINNKVDSPIITNNTTGEFYKQPMFYAMGHFSKFIIPKSVVMDVQNEYSSKVKSLTVLRPDNITAAVIFNEHLLHTKIEILTKEGLLINTIVPGRSINTILF